ncbi:MAG: WecB/TagA/CpsF family glycosyltransferase [Gallionella sp.]|nr:WecB/TagA/CpsF family glycosyltransferase [Gallionella sp.]
MNPPLSSGKRRGSVLLTQNILGYTVYSASLGQCVDSIVSRITSKDAPCWLACINPHSYVAALDESDFSDALHGADWLIPDGSGIVLASYLLGGNIRQRITGSDIFSALNSRANELGGFSVFFLGVTPDCLEEIRVRMGREYPQIRFAGSYSPLFKQDYTEEELEAMFAAINQARPDILWVGMTAPKQEKWIHQNLHRLDVCFAAAIGAVFDFYTGRVKRSHPVFQRLGLEWLPRLIQEPGRLWKRMFISAPVFMWHVLRARLRSSVKSEL